MTVPSTRKILLGLIDRGGPRDDLNFEEGIFPPGINFTRPSAATVYAPNRLGPEMAVNGEFTDNLSGWTVAGNGSAVWEAGSAKIEFGAPQTLLRQVHSVNPGDTYEVTVKLRKGTSTAIQFYLEAGAGDEYVGAQTSTEQGTYTYQFCPVSDTLTIWGRVYDAGHSFIDSVSLKRRIIGQQGDPLSLVRVGINRPRIGYSSVDGKCLGFLNERPNANIWPHSTDARYHANSGLVVTHLSDTGMLNDRFTSTPQTYNYFNGNLPGHPVVPHNPSTEYVASLFVKHVSGAGLLTYEVNVGGGGYASYAFNMNSDGLVEIVNNGERQHATEIGDGIYLLEVNYAVNELGGSFLGVWYFGDYGPGPSVLTIDVGHAQVEGGKRATSRIKTGYSTAYRGIEVAWGAVVPQPEFTIAVDFSTDNPNDFGRVFQLGEIGQNMMGLWLYNGTAYQHFKNGVVPEEIQEPFGANHVLKGIHRAAFSLKSGRTARSSNGDSVTVSTAPVSIPSFINIFIGCEGVHNPLNGYIRRIRLYRRVLSDVELQVVTALSDAIIEKIGLRAKYDFTLGYLPAGVGFSRASRATVTCPNSLGTPILPEYLDFPPNVTESSPGVFTISADSVLRNFRFVYPTAQISPTKPYRITFTVDSVSGHLESDYVDAHGITVFGPGTYSFAATGNPYGFYFVDFAIPANVSGQIRDVKLQELLLNNANDPISTIQVPDNTPRFQWDPVTKECLGFLTEPARSNVARWSNDYANPVWSVTNNVSGTLNTLTFGSDGLRYGQNNSGSALAGQAWVLSVTLSAPVETNIALRMADNAVGNDQAHTVITVGPIKKRVSLKHTFGFTTDSWVIFGLDNRPMFGGSGVSRTITAEEWQMERGYEPTSYIPTREAAATRAEDIAPASTSDYHKSYASREGTVTVDYSTTMNGGYAAVAFENPGTGRMRIYRPNNVSMEALLQAHAGAYAYASLPLADQLDRRAALGYSRSKIFMAANGQVAQGADHGIALPRPTHIGFGNSYVDGNVLRMIGLIKEVRYFDRMLSPQELKATTK